MDRDTQTPFLSLSEALADLAMLQALRQQVQDVFGIPRLMIGEGVAGFVAEMERYKYVPRPRSKEKDDDEPFIW